MKTDMASAVLIIGDDAVRSHDDYSVKLNGVSVINFIVDALSLKSERRQRQAEDPSLLSRLLRRQAKTSIRGGVSHYSRPLIVARTSSNEAKDVLINYVIFIC